MVPRVNYGNRLSLEGSLDESAINSDTPWPVSMYDVHERDRSGERPRRPVEPSLTWRCEGQIDHELGVSSGVGNVVRIG